MLGALLGAVPVMQGQSGAASEYAVKAAFLFHFAQFVEWPAAAFRDASSPLVYCTIGLDPFQGALDAALSGKMIGARAFQVRHYKEAQEAHGCHVLFIGAEQKRQLSAALSELKGTPVLVVGESDKFVDEGGMIGFSLEENKVRFEINLEAAEKAGLKISAKLLALAKTVRGAPKRG
jgi:hypothetical protein